MTYTLKEVQILHDKYNANPCLEVVDKLSVLLNKPRRSIISKLSKEGIYNTLSYKTKLGKTPITKLEVLRSIEDALDVKLPGLDKAPKGTLQILANCVIDVGNTLEETLNTIQDASETKVLIAEISQVKETYPKNLL